jgi:serine/threonine-protein kinase RsbW
MVELKLKVTEAPDMRIVMPNRAENVAVVRQALTGIADAMRLDDGLLSDIKTAVSEACNNVVLHAYDGREGPLEVYICPEQDELDVVVRDQGLGIQPHRPEPDAGVQGVGLSLIQALTDRVEVRGSAGEGTEVRMGFHASGDIASDGIHEAVEQIEPPAGETVVSVAAGAFAAPVLGRVTAMLAARAGFSVDRLADAVLVSDAIAAHAPESIIGRHIHVAIDTAASELELKVGPLDPGGGERLVDASAVGGMPAVVEQLADGVDVEAERGDEELHVRLSDGR